MKSCTWEEEMKKGAAFRLPNEVKKKMGILHKGSKVVDTFFKSSDPIAHQYIPLKLGFTEPV